MKFRLSAALGLSAALLLSACAANEDTSDDFTAEGSESESAANYSAP